MICQVVVQNVRCLEDGRIYIAACVHEHVAKVCMCDRCAALITRPKCVPCEEIDGHECIAVMTLRPGEA